MISCESPAYFISDCHLPLISKSGQEEWGIRATQFIRRVAPRASTLFLVGDLFDFWFEWRHSVPKGVFQVLAALHELVRSGCRIFFIAGNHDGHPGNFLRDEVGLEIFRNAVDAEIDGKRFHIIHGDGIAVQDRGYRVLRRLVRWKPTEAIYRLIHPDLGIWFASKISQTSREVLSSLDKFGAEPYRSYADRKLREGCNYVVMGHRHIAEWIPHPNGGYLAIGEWIRAGSYGIYEHGTLKLAYYHPDENERPEP